MKKMTMTMLAACAAAIVMTMTTGCKSIEVERRGQEVATVKDADGNHTVVYDKDGKAIILDKGWSVDYFQHWNWQKFDSLAAETKEAKLAINNYEGGADATNLTQLVHVSLDGLTKLAVAVGEAYVKIAGGGAQADTALNVAARVTNYFRDLGGDVTKATVTTTADNKVQVSDGTTCVSCDSAGNCTDCTPAK